jgi:hypothetical protein
MERLHVASRVARFPFAASPIEIKAEPIELAASPFEISAGPFEITAAPNEIAAGADVFASSPFEICDDRPGKPAKSFGWNTSRPRRARKSGAPLSSTRPSVA